MLSELLATQTVASHGYDVRNEIWSLRISTAYLSKASALDKEANQPELIYEL